MRIFKICCVLSLLLSLGSIAQDKQLNEFLAKLDTSAIKNKALFNKVVFTKGLLEMLRTKEKDSSGQPIMNISKSQFKTFTNVVEQSDLNKKSKPTAMIELFDRTTTQLTQSNIIPIGIINAETTFLTPQQLDENTKAKTNNQPINSDAYEIIPIKMAGLLQDEIFQGNVSFQLSPNLVQTNINDPIEKISLDFQDGKGEQVVDLKNTLISHQFTTLGTVAISIKVTTKKGSFLTYCPLEIRLLERPAVYKTGTVSVAKVRLDEIKNGRIANNVTGAEYAIYTGCDNVFDKPIIIVEGFDANQDVDITTLLGKYYSYLYALRNNGYDLVFVNYTDGRDYIENNAEVLKSIINQVNYLKVGNEQLTIVGESMSGLVARYALKTMENAGQTHHVGHFISFDSPQKGANVPAGAVALRRWATYAAFPWTLIFDELNNLFNVIPFLKALDSPAAKQMLLTYSTVGPAPEYFALQNTLNNLGYPSQNGIRNVALINGTLDGSNQFKYVFNNGHSVTNGILQAGDKIMEIQYFYVLANLSVNVWTNQVNQSTKVFEGFSLILFPLPSAPSYERTYVTLPINYDRLPGGVIFSTFGSIPMGFSFVPTFSSIDYKGTLNNDADYNFSIYNFINSNSQVTNANLTPFVAIYGDYDNSSHSFSNRLTNAWNTLTYQEFGINSNSVLASCVASLPTPTATKQIASSGVCAFNPRSVNGCSNVPVLTTFPTSICGSRRIMCVPPQVPSCYPAGTFDQFIRITGNNGFVRTYDANSSPKIIPFDTYPTGTYTVSTVLRYYNQLLSRSQVSSDEKSVSTTLTVFGNCRLAACDFSGGELIAWLSDIDTPVYAYSNNGGAMWYAMLNDGTFIPQSRLIANGLDANSASCFATRVETVQNGAWNDPNTWLPNFVPRYSDDIIIKTGHRVWLMPYMGIQYCHKAEVQAGSVFDCTGILQMNAGN